MTTAVQEIQLVSPPLEPPVDLVHLSRVTFGNRALEREVLGLFLRQSMIQLDRIKEARSPEGFGAAAHTLKGAAQAVGAGRVAEIAAEAEAVAERHDTAEGFAVVARLEARITESRTYITMLLAGGN